MSRHQCARNGLSPNSMRARRNGARTGRHKNILRYLTLQSVSRTLLTLAAAGIAPFRSHLLCSGDTTVGALELANRYKPQARESEGMLRRILKVSRR
jgi:hypothetical protein